MQISLPLNKINSAWHRWFAWHPIQLGSYDYVWLEYIWRRCDCVTYIFGKTFEIPFRYEYSKEPKPEAGGAE